MMLDVALVEQKMAFLLLNAENLIKNTDNNTQVPDSGLLLKSYILNLY